MLSVSFIAASISSPALCMAVCMLDVSVQSPSPFGWSGSCFTALIGGSGGFTLFQGILMFSIVFADLFPSISTLGTSVNLFDVSVWFLAPSVSSTRHFVSPGPRYMLMPSPRPMTSVSALFNMFKVFANPLDPST